MQKNIPVPNNNSTVQPDDKENSITKPVKKNTTTFRYEKKTISLDDLIDLNAKRTTEQLKRNLQKLVWEETLIEK